MRDMLAQAIRHNRLVVPDVLREAEHNAAELMRLYHLRDAFTRRHRDPPPSATAHATPAVSPTTPSRTSSPRPTQSSPGAMSLTNMVAHQTLMSLPLAAPVPVPGPTPHPLPLFTLVPHGRPHGGIPVPAPGPNPPPLIPAYAQYAQYTTRPPPAITPPQQAQQATMEEDQDPGSPAEVDELADEDKSGPATATTTDAQPDRPKKRSRPTRAHPSSPRVCTTCSRTDSPEWRRGPHGPKTLCNACGLKWAKASGAGRRRGGGVQTNPTNDWRGEPFSSNLHSPASRPGTADPFQGPSTAALVPTTSLPAPSSLPPSLAAGLPPGLVGSSVPISSVPPNPRSPVGSHSPDVKVETDAPSGLMDLATVAALESGRNEPRSAIEPTRNGPDPRDEPQQQTLKRPRADSSYNGLGRGYDRPPSSRTPSSTRGYADSYGGYDKVAYPDSGNSSSRAPYSDSSRAYSSGSEAGTTGGVRPINVIPIGNYRD
ncbi:White collar 1 protein [Rhizoctonia solani]|uniref:White collar 1 protein n=1 Tax=Rhizoctonia solani TaxID=456999 RepID=A0A0K6FM61_9AGAM|nr:White collar 1 protein [Rhizoctonia solani]